ncbi:DUF6397 family protein [Streptomyces sp. NPDC004610]|uniref:DUF6397 family protein n=1 Tax=unclassified Streptomyces TaxID=2593676 RepID=UPI0033BF3D77
MSGNTFAPPDSAFWTTGRAARELGLSRKDLELAVNLGRVRSVPDPLGPHRLVTRAEIDRLRTEDEFPQNLWAAIQTVAAPEGGRMLDICADRFHRLGKLGLLVPVSFCFNRYRAFVWLYLADEVRRFGADERNTRHLRGRSSKAMANQLKEGLDLRARNWRGRHLGMLLRQAEDPWAQAAAIASLLDRSLIPDIVRDPCERAQLNRFRPVTPAYGAPGSRTADAAARAMTATDADEIDWLRTDLAQALAEARTERPAPRPAPRPTGPTDTAWPRRATPRPSGATGPAWPRRAALRPSGAPDTAWPHRAAPRPSGGGTHTAWPRQTAPQPRGATGSASPPPAAPRPSGPAGTASSRPTAHGLVTIAPAPHAPGREERRPRGWLRWFRRRRA